MTQFEDIEPTDLLMRIRRGEVDDTGNRDVILAISFARFMKVHVENIVERYQYYADRDLLPKEAGSVNGGSELSPEERHKRFFEVVMTGMQLTVEQTVQGLTDMVDQPAQAITE